MEWDVRTTRMEGRRRKGCCHRNKTKETCIIELEHEPSPNRCPPSKRFQPLLQPPFSQWHSRPTSSNKPILSLSTAPQTPPSNHACNFNQALLLPEERLGEWQCECEINVFRVNVACCVKVPDTLGRYGGGEKDAEVVSDVSGWRGASVEARRSELRCEWKAFICI
jgi:hypothetical protein